MTSWSDILAWAATSTRPANDCQGFAGQDFTTRFGSFAKQYATANAAMEASKTAGSFHAGVTPPNGQVVWVFFAYPVDGHVGLYYNGQCLWDSTHSTSFLNPAKTVGLGTIAGYPYTYLGYATTNGANTIPTIPTPVIEGDIMQMIYVPASGSTPLKHYLVGELTFLEIDNPSGDPSIEVLLTGQDLAVTAAQATQIQADVAARLAVVVAAVIAALPGGQNDQTAVLNAIAALATEVAGIKFPTTGTVTLG